MRLRISLMLAGLSLTTASMISGTAGAAVAIGVFVNFAPPELPVYEQPPVPGPDYIWSPGYWAWGGEDYYWVPGTWVEAPSPGLLWTPGYWGYSDEGVYVWNAGYWGPRVGYYGGINYGFGYVGVGFLGGRWEGGVFAYNRAVTNVGSVRITNVYNQTVVNNTTVINNNTSFNGGKGGTTAKPTPVELAAAKDPHIAPTALQTQHQQAASTNRALFASVNQGKPAVAASPKPGVFSGHGVVAAKAVGTGAKGAPGSGQSLTGARGTGQATTNSATGARGTGQAATNSAIGVKGTGHTGTNSATGAKGTGASAATSATAVTTPRPPGPGPQATPKPPPKQQPHPPGKDAGKKPPG
jgi:hypothetical protein